MHRICGRVLLSRLFVPLAVERLGDVFLLQSRDDKGRKHFYSTNRLPQIIGENGVSITLLGELAAGSVVNVLADGPTVRAIQLIEPKYVTRSINRMPQHEPIA